MFKIGDFSRFTRVSIKMLRYYDEMGLLKPVRIDPVTNYRYYAADQLPRLNRIIALKDLGFTLDQIEKLLRDDLPADQLRGMYKLRQAEVEQQLIVAQLRLAQIESRLRTIEGEACPPLYEVVTRQIAPQWVVALRQTVPDSNLAPLFDEVEAYAAQHGVRAIGGPLTIYHDPDYRETDLDVEVAVPITREVSETDRLRVYELPGGNMACIVYTGSYDKTASVLATLLIWIQSAGYEIAGLIREVYLRFNADHSEELKLPTAFLTENSQLYVTEVQLPIHKE